jgi:uncharacterized protein YggE
LKSCINPLINHPSDYHPFIIHYCCQPIAHNVSNVTSANRIITVRGIGRVTFVPDIINLGIEIKNRDNDLLTAVGKTKETVIKFLEICKKFNILDEDIRTTNVNTNKSYKYNNETKES